MHQILKARLARARGLAGAFDLPSIIVGVVVVGILTAGVLAAIFAVIPFAQDNAAKQDLDAARTAEGVALAKDGSYLDAAGLSTKTYLPIAETLRIGTNTGKNCYVAVSASGSGKVFFNSNTHPEPQIYTEGTSTDPCLPVGDLVPSPAPGGTPGSDLPVPPGALLVTPTVAVNMSGNHAISGYGKVTDNSVLTSWGVPIDTAPGAETWVQPGEGAPFTLSYYDKRTKGYVDYYTHDSMWPDQDATIIQRGTLVFASIHDYAPEMTAGKTVGFGKMLADGGKLTFLPLDGNGTTKATVIMGPATVTTTAPDGPASDYEERPSWKPLLALAEACYGNPDTTRAGASWMTGDTVPAAASDISVRSQVFNYGAKDVYRSGVADINAPVPACTYSADIVLDNPLPMYSMLQDPRPWQVTGTWEWSDGSGNTATMQDLILPADDGTPVKLSYFDPATGGFKQFYSAAAGDGQNGTASLKASYSETVTRSSDGGWLSTDRDPMHVALEFTPGTTEYADLYRVMSTYGGFIEFTAAGKTVTVRVGPDADYRTIDPFFVPYDGGGAT